MKKEFELFTLKSDINNINWLIYNKYENRLEFIGTIPINDNETEEYLYKRVVKEYKKFVSKFLYGVFNLYDLNRSTYYE